MSNDNGEFSLYDYVDAERPSFDIGEDVTTTLEAMLRELNAFCKKNEIPFFGSVVLGNTEGTFHLSSSTNLPLGRFPEEYLLMAELARSGIDGGLSLLMALKQVIQERQASGHQGSIIL